MLRSMTGFGRERLAFDEREILVEIRSVNHRFYEFTARTPRAYGYLDEKLKSLLNGGTDNLRAISRGKVEVSVYIYNKEGVNADITVNRELAHGYLDALRAAAPELGVEDDIKLSDVMRLPDLFTVVKTQENEEQVWEQVRQTAEKALGYFVEMREVEGEKMHADISSRLKTIEEKVRFVEERSPSVTEVYREKLAAKIAEVVGDRNIDDARILTEAAIFSEKTAVDEETVRLHSHIAQFRQLIESDEPVGRKLDFLVQEMNREVNTTGSKCSDLDITRVVVDMKSEIEKIREQIQNIE
ncbi:MAG: YicC family protein [Ruminococcus sp.]|nr:YicC family protein [Ruminococcus sp.]